MDMILCEQVFTSLKSTVMRLVLALYLFSKASYWFDVMAAGDVATADAPLAGVGIGRLWAFKEEEWYARNMFDTISITFVSEDVYVLSK